VPVYTALGVFFGIPAEQLFGRFQNLTVRAAIAAAILAGSYLALRRVPHAHHEEPVSEQQAGWPLAAAFGIDVGLVAVLMLIVGLLVRFQIRNPEAVLSAVLVVGVIWLAYLLVARRSAGHTLGEALMNVHYP